METNTYLIHARTQERNDTEMFHLIAEYLLACLRFHLHKEISLFQEIF
jgi:hypothetical protein